MAFRPRPKERRLLVRLPQSNEDMPMEVGIISQATFSQATFMPSIKSWPLTAGDATHFRSSLVSPELEGGEDETMAV